MGYMTDEQFQKKIEKIKLRNYQIELKNELKAEKNKAKRFTFPKMKTSKVVLLTAIMAVILFSIACLYIQYATSVEVSSTLITLWFSFWTVEIVSLAGIKVSKVFKDYHHVVETEIDDEYTDGNVVG